MKNFALVSYIVCLLCLQTTINSQQTCPTFYTGANLQGDSFQMCSSGDVPSQWNNQAVSFYVPSGYFIQLYPDPGYNGQNLGYYLQGSHNVPTNGQLSSVIVSPPQTQAQSLTQTNNPKCPTFYRNENQHGDSFQMCSSGDVPDQWNDQTASFYVPFGYSVHLYQDSGFSGQDLGSYIQGSYNVPIRGELSSIIISQTHTQTQTQTQTSNETCPTFYRDLNQQGDSFQLCSSGEVPDGWNDQASSLYVPKGYTVLLYQHSGFGGVNFGSYSQGSYNVPADYDNQLSSVIISQSQSAVAIPTATAAANTNTTTPAPTNANTTVTIALPANAPVAQAEPSVQSKPTGRKCPTFYRDIDQQGDSFMLCSSGNVPSSWDNQVSSFYIPPGYHVRLYPKHKYNGRDFGIYSQGFYNVPSNYNDQLSSVMMIKR